MNETRRCTAHRRDGQPCKAAAINGGTVCRVHGGSAPQVRRSARLRLLELVDPAISTMAKIMNNPGASEQARIRAAENILDRAGYPRAVTVDSDSAKDLLMVRLLELRSQALAERDQVVEEARDIVEGEVVDTNTGDDRATTPARTARRRARNAEQPEPLPDIPPDTPRPSEDQTADDDQEHP